MMFGSRCTHGKMAVDRAWELGDRPLFPRISTGYEPKGLNDGFEGGNSGSAKLSLTFRAQGLHESIMGIP